MKRLLACLPLLAACAADRPVLEVRDAYGYQPVLGDVAAVYFTVENRGRAADTLQGADVAGAQVAMIHEQVTEGDRAEMRHLDMVPVPGGTVLVLRPGGLHLMVEGFERAPVAGDTLLVTVRFASGDTLLVRAPVLAYGDEPR
ncbi:MAG TPA: copper chaperone PCu(A)C [Gemmatimonadales bacterium]|nr:copper chaperone PCu(A)C [Gemmatimonadales bacterium]